MKPSVTACLRFCPISTFCVLALLSACTEHNVKKLDKIVVGSSVILDKHAFACEEPSDDLNQLATAEGTVRTNLATKISHREACHDSAAFLANGEWQVLAVNDKQLRIKMRGYLGEYWVSRAQVSASEPSAKTRADAVKTPVPVGPVTVDEWRKALDSAYEQSSTKKSDDGVTTYFASFKAKAYAFVKYDAFNKTYLFTPAATQLYGDFMSNIRCHVLVSEGRPPVIVVSPLYWSRDGESDLSMRKLAVLLDGELLFERDFQATDVKRRPAGAGVEESAIAMLSEDELRSMRKITKESRLSIRLTGTGGYVNLKKGRATEPVELFKSSIIDSLAIYDGINSATAGHMPEQKSAAL